MHWWLKPIGPGDPYEKKASAAESKIRKEKSWRIREDKPVKNPRKYNRKRTT